MKAIGITLANWLAKKLASFVLGLILQWYDSYMKKKENDKAHEKLKEAETKEEFRDAIDDIAKRGSF